jgi:hypothetical protein
VQHKLQSRCYSDAAGARCAPGCIANSTAHTAPHCREPERRLLRALCWLLLLLLLLRLAAAVLLSSTRASRWCGSQSQSCKLSGKEAVWVRVSNWHARCRAA